MLDFGGIDVYDSMIKLSTALISNRMRHKRSTSSGLVENNLSKEILALYLAV